MTGFSLIPFCDRFSTEDCERFFRPARSRSENVAALRRAESDTAGRKKIRKIRAKSVANWYEAYEKSARWFFVFRAADRFAAGGAKHHLGAFSARGQHA